MSESPENWTPGRFQIALDSEMVADMNKLMLMQSARGKPQPWLWSAVLQELAKAGLKSALVYEQMLLDQHDGLVF